MVFLLGYISNQVGIPVAKVASIVGPTYASWLFSHLPTWSWQVSRFFLQGIIHDKIIKSKHLPLHEHEGVLLQLYACPVFFKPYPGHIQMSLYCCLVCSLILSLPLFVLVYCSLMNLVEPYSHVNLSFITCMLFFTC